jgi:hypothetical protein
MDWMSEEELQKFLFPPSIIYTGRSFKERPKVSYLAERLSYQRKAVYQRSIGQLAVPEAEQTQN